MKHIIRLFILIAALVLGTDHAWADTESNPRVNFVYVEGDNYALTSDKGIAFASDETTGEVTITVKIFDGQDYRCIKGDLTAEQSINSNMGQARRRTSAEGPGNGVPVDVNCTKTNEFTLTLPEDESTNVTVYVRFSEKIRLNITADDLSVYWGSIAAPEFTVSCDGFQEGDDISKLEGTLTIDCDYSVDSEIGEKYAITPSGLTSADYAIHFRQGALTVKEVIVKVSVVDAINVKLDGAYVQVLDGEERVDFWTSGGSAYKIDGLKAGKTYTLRETAAPEGYMIPSDITFTIDAEGKVATTGTTTTDEEGNTVLVLKNRRLLTHNNISVEAIDDQTWTGSAITPAVVVKDGEMDITDQCDISYSDNTDAGQATITITAKDGSDYAGSTTVHFLIYKTANTYYVDADGTRHDNIPAIVLSGYENSLNEGTYLVESDINVDHQIDLYGNVTIILGDDAEMNISNYPIYGGYSAMLTIYGQTQHGGEMIFSCNNSNIYCLEVGGGITINSGTVYVRTEYSDCQGIHTNGDLTINGGTIDINVTDAAIYAGGTVRINGGQVTAISTGNGNSSYGIYSANSDIILGYANASDFVNASSYRTDINKGYIARIKDGLMMRNHSDIYDKYNSMAAYNNGICQFNGIKLEPVPCTVTFDIEVEGNVPESQTVLYGFYAIEPTAPTREGYDFAGWKNGEDDYDFATPVAGDLTLTAKWEILRFEIDGIGITYEWTSETTVKVVGYNGASTSITILPSVEHNGVSYNVTEIGEEAFKDNKSLVSIDLLPEAGHITVIGARAFKGCTNLSDNDNRCLPASLTTIEEEAFSGCNLTKITIPETVTSIGQRAFADCPSLTSVTIPANVTNISDDAFEGCSENLIIYVPDGLVESYQKRWPDYIILPEGAVPYIDADGKMAYCTDFTVLTGSTEDVTLGSDGETTWYVVNDDVNYDNRINLVGNVNLILCDDKTVTCDGGSASAIVGRSNLTIYGQTAGTGKLVAQTGEGCGICSNAITINGGTVDAHGTYNHSAIYADGNITINGGNVSAYGNQKGIEARGNIILGWTNITTDRISAKNYIVGGTISIANGKVFTDGTNVYNSATPSSTLAALTDVTLIPKKDFTKCKATVPNQTRQYNRMFYQFEAANQGNYSVGETIEDGETTLTLGQDYEFGSIEYADPNKTPSYAQYEGDYDQFGDEFVVTINGKGDYAGSKTATFTLIAEPTNGTWGDLTWEISEDGTLSITGTGAMNEANSNSGYPWFKKAGAVKTITVGEGVTSIAANAFAGTSNTSSYSNATTVNLPSTLTTIGTYAFAFGSALTSVAIPASVTSIGENAFYQCGNMTDVYCYADPTKLTWTDESSDDFKSGDEKTNCHVFKASTWSDFDHVNVSFVGDLGSSTCPVVLSEGDGVDMLTSLAGRTDITTGTEVNVTFSRTFDTNTAGTGKASTVCLPYAVTTPDASVGTFYTFGGVTESGGVYTVTMNAVAAGTTTTAGTPYLFKPAGGSAVPFSGQIAIADTYSEGTPPSTDGWEFRGTFEKITWPRGSGQTRLYGFAAADFESNGTQIGADEVGKFRRFDWGICDAFRCYLLAPDPSSARGVSKSGSLPETLRVVLVGANGQTTAIGTLDARTGDVTFDSDAWYTLDGTKLDGKPTKSGVYINNGKKIVVK